MNIHDSVYVFVVFSHLFVISAIFFFFLSNFVSVSQKSTKKKDKPVIINGSLSELKEHTIPF